MTHAQPLKLVMTGLCLRVEDGEKAPAIQVKHAFPIASLSAVIFAQLSQTQYTARQKTWEAEVGA